MAKSKYTIRRRIIQGMSLAVLLSIPLRFFCFDIENECLRIYGQNSGYQTMFYPLFTIIVLLLFVIFKSMSKGRIFCSHMCPMHMFLEIVNSPETRNSSIRPRKMGITAILLSFLLTQVFISFFQPINQQVRLFREGNILMIGVFSASMITFICLFVVYQEKFCKRACPYALMQMLLQSDRTRTVEFSNETRMCTNCKSCDSTCPFNLRPRFESISPDCTNCNLCAEACTNELGEGNTLFHFNDQEKAGSA